MPLPAGGVYGSPGTAGGHGGSDSPGHGALASTRTGAAGPSHLPHGLVREPSARFLFRPAVSGGQDGGPLLPVPERAP
jgi:hypothetical protein